MNITIENKKQKAIELMNKLEIYKPYIKGFKDKNSVCFYENFGGFWAYQEPELMAKIKEEWDEMLYPQGNMFYAYAYVWNKSDDFCSEFGTIGIRSFGGGIKRVA